MDPFFDTKPIPPGSWDVVVIGAGAAGLMTCLQLPSQLKVLLLNRNTSKRSSSRWAQGGIAAVIRPEDSLDSHAEDTLKAGCDLCDIDSVKMLVEEAPKCVERLQKLGMEFDRDANGLATTIEAAHTYRRVLHVQDQTGKALVDVLREQVEQRKNVLHRRGVRVTQLWVENNACCGVQVLDGPLLYWVHARAVVLASGGGGHLFANTTNPPQACGEGLALAWKAGAALEDLEFFQFHPTALKLQGSPSFLISEAVRGEGGVLVDSHGNSPVSHLFKKDLAPRDQVSRALVQSMQMQGVNHIGLDLMSIRYEKVCSRFPSLVQRCKEMGIDPFNDFIPIAPAAHYWMGGIATDLNAVTSLPSLYAVGEVACTGAHGANRLASNSLLECLVLASQMESIELNHLSNKRPTRTNCFQVNFPHEFHEMHKEDYLRSSIKDLRDLFWKEAGVNRSKHGIQIALKQIKLNLYSLEEDPFLQLVFNQSKEVCNKLDEKTRSKLNLLLDLNHRLLTSLLTLNACFFRRESRGGHYRLDYPSSQPYWKCHSRQVRGQPISTRSVRY